MQRTDLRLVLSVQRLKTMDDRMVFRRVHLGERRARRCRYTDEAAAQDRRSI